LQNFAIFFASFSAVGKLQKRPFPALDAKVKFTPVPADLCSTGDFHPKLPDEPPLQNPAQGFISESGVEVLK